jgi:hypothetical protein
MVRINNPNGEPRKSKYLEELRRRSGGNPTGKFRMRAEYENPEAKIKWLLATAHDCHERCEALERSKLRHAKTAGQCLLELKELVGHGNWLNWLKENFRPSADTAERYMMIARDWDILDKKLTNDPDASVSECLRDIRGRRPQPAEPPSTKVVVEVSPAMEARRKLLELIKKQIVNRLTDDDVLYVMRFYEEDDWWELANDIMDQFNLANYLMPVYSRWERQKKKLEHLSYDARHAAYQRLDVEFYRDVIRALAGRVEDEREAMVRLLDGRMEDDRLCYHSLERLTHKERDVLSGIFEFHSSCPPYLMRNVITGKIQTHALQAEVEIVVRLINPKIPRRKSDQRHAG